MKEYADTVIATDLLLGSDLRSVLMGLFGEVGSAMAPTKKLRREGQAYLRHAPAAIEEFGDALWYFFAMVRRLDWQLPKVIAQFEEALVAEAANPHADSYPEAEIDQSLLDLGFAAAALLVISSDRSGVPQLVRQFADAYLHAVALSKLSLETIVARNIAKVNGRFAPINRAALPVFDAACSEDEQLPQRFEILIKQRPSGQAWLQWNGVFIGDALTDNIWTPDGYRFHDVFHFAHAAILHWSPVVRSLVKQKRKSVPRVDEAQDGGRAIVIEEGLTAWLFSRAREYDYFEHQTTISFDILKTIQEFVTGYEVADCPLSLWEDAILQGYSVFRALRKEKAGLVIGDRAARTIKLRSTGVVS